MRIAGNATLHAPVEAVYAALQDPAVLVRTIPGCERLVATGSSGAYAWCYGDYDQRLFDRAPLSTAVRERTFGLVRADGSEKRAADVFRKFRQRRDNGMLDNSAAVVPSILDISPDEYYRLPQAHFNRLYATWLSSHGPKHL